MSEALASVKFIRVSPRKVRRVVDLVRGKDVKTAVNILKFSPHSASEVVLKVVNSAVANHKQHNPNNKNPDSLLISKIFADEAPTLKRFRAKSRGTAGKIMKRASHITVAVSEIEDQGKEK